jgi:hypothetical protein
MTKCAHDLQPGDVVIRVPYPGPEVLPITVHHIARAIASGYVILIGDDATGRRIQVPLGHRTNVVEVVP